MPAGDSVSCSSLASIRDPERAASLFAEDGAFELPFLRSLGIEPRYTGRREITALLHQLLKLYFAFAPDDIRPLIGTPEKTFVEYVAHARADATMDESRCNTTQLTGVTQYFSQNTSWN